MEAFCVSNVRFSALATAELSTSVLDAVASSSREDLSCSAYSLPCQDGARVHHVTTSKTYCNVQAQAEPCLGL